MKDHHDSKQQLKNCGLWPSHYLSGLAFSWNAMFNNTKVELELIPDPAIVFEKVTKDGVSFISDRYSQANNKYLKSYDPKQDSKQILGCK